MNVALIGLGKMGEAIAYRLLLAGHKVFGFDLDSTSCALAQKIGVQIVDNIDHFAHKNITVFWLMVPQGELVDKVISQLHSILTPGAIIIDGGNSKFSDSVRRAQALVRIERRAGGARRGGRNQ